MPIVKAKPTSPGRRFVEKVVHPHLYKGRPHAPLVEAQGRSGGRNNNGRITSRHIGFFIVITTTYSATKALCFTFNI